MSDQCEDKILSQDTAEFLILSYSMTDKILEMFRAICYQQISARYFTVYTPLSEIDLVLPNIYFYRIIPRLYVEMTTTALEVSGITRLANQPVLQLRGQGVVIGVVDSGIDYTHPAFLDEFGNTRILRIWDQTSTAGNPPEGFLYGTEYTEDDINRALHSNDPLSIVNSTDSTGHGTFLTGVAAGSENRANDFTGAAPAAKIIVVKLKPAKNYLREFFFVNDGTVVYQENDIMIGINYLRKLSLEMNLPLSIPFGLGSSLSGHTGNSALAYTVNSITNLLGSCICIPTGNNGYARQHFRGITKDANVPEVMEISVDSNVNGFVFEIWGANPYILSISITSPTGEVISRIPARLWTMRTYKLLFEETIINVYYDLVEFQGGNQVIFVRLTSPTVGIWKINVYSNMADSVFDSYLPGLDFVDDSVYFLTSDPDITLTDPSSAPDVITVSGYDPISGSFYPPSGRGFTRSGLYKPDICAPCVGITGPSIRGGYETRSGTSLGAALTAGACAQFLTWGITLGNFPALSSNTIKTYLIRGASRYPDILYPSKMWGYGTLDVYNAFESLREN